MELVVDRLAKDFGSNRVLDAISFSLAEGRILAIVGPNGSGKSTLIKSITRILDPTSGSISLDGIEIKKIDPADLATRIGYVPQQFTFTLYSTVFETVLLGRRRYIRWSVSDEELERVQHALDALEMGDLAGKFMDQLSGGERQKVFIARALAQNPELYLFDEPTSALDLRYQIEVMETMREITHNGDTSMIIAVHDLNLAYRYADDVLMLDRGTMAGFGKPADILTPSSIQEVYGISTIVANTIAGPYIVPVSIHERRR